MNPDSECPECGTMTRNHSPECRWMVRPVEDVPMVQPDMEDLELTLTERVTGNRPAVRRDCAFCHRERSARDDNHAPDCPYWDFFG